MILQGPIDTDLLRRFNRAMAEPHDRIDTVLLDSTGGYEAIALQIATALARPALREIVVPPGYACESACVLIGLAAGTGFNPADTARLMFHRGTATFGPTTCTACEFPDRLLNSLKDRIEGPEWHREMKRWANLLAPGLGDRLATCRQGAFDTQEGITISGLAFKRFRAGQSDAIPC